MKNGQLAAPEFHAVGACRPDPHSHRFVNIGPCYSRAHDALAQLQAVLKDRFDINSEINQRSGGDFPRDLTIELDKQRDLAGSMQKMAAITRQRETEEAPNMPESLVEDIKYGNALAQRDAEKEIPYRQ